MISLISELYKKYKPVKEYFDFYIDPNEGKVLTQYKEKVTEGFFPKRGDQLKLSLSRKAINNFKKLGTSQESVADLLLHYTECGVKFTNSYGDINENFYSSVENTYASALEILAEESILDKFKERAFKIVNNTDGIGWGFHDYLYNVYCDHYGGKN